MLYDGLLVIALMFMATIPFIAIRGGEPVESGSLVYQAAMLATRSVDEASDRLALLRDRLFDRLSAAIGPDLTINGHKAERLPNTLSVNFPRVLATRLLARIPELCASTGAACHSGRGNVSASLAAIGLPAEIAQGTVRFSVGWYTSEEEIDRASSLLIAAWEDLCQ